MCKYRTCKGSLFLDSENNVFNESLHSCQITAEIKKSIVLEQSISNKIENSNERFIDIYTSLTSKHDQETLSHLTCYKNMRDYARKKRNLRDEFNLDEFQDIPHNLQVTLNGVKFLQHDSGVNSLSRWLIFFSDDFIEYLFNLEIIIINGTFTSAPVQFFQLITIQGYAFGRFIPFIFILKQEKTEEKYAEIFLFLRSKNILSPKIVITDFEKVLINSSQFLGNNVVNYNCLFHFGPCIYRKIQSLGLADQYKNNLTINTAFKLFLNLPFINPERKNEALEFIK